MPLPFFSLASASGGRLEDDWDGPSPLGGIASWYTRVMAVRMVFFDLDDTLLDHRGASVRAGRAVCAKHAELASVTADEAEFEAYWYELTERHMDAFFEGLLTHEEQRRMRMKELHGQGGVTLDDEQADAAFEFYLAVYRTEWRLFDDALPCLATLEERGLRLGCITNGKSATQRPKLEDLALGERLSPIVVTGELGFHKPDPRVFRHALEQAELPAGECLYVGDKLDSDALAAAAVGLRGVWLARRDEPEASRVSTIRTLRELPRLV